MGRRRIHINSGDKFGQWTVLREVALGNYPKRVFLCRCECGAERRIPINNLYYGYSSQRRKCAASFHWEIGRGSRNEPAVPTVWTRIKSFFGLR